MPERIDTNWEEFVAWRDNATTQKYRKLVKGYVLDGRIQLGSKKKFTEDEVYLSGYLQGVDVAWELDYLLDLKKEEVDND